MQEHLLAVLQSVNFGRDRDRFAVEGDVVARFAGQHIVDRDAVGACTLEKGQRIRPAEMNGFFGEKMR